MADAKRIKHERELVEFMYRKHSQVRELSERFEQLAVNPAFIRHFAGLHAFQTEVDPIPNRDAHEDLLRAVGHEFAAVEALPRGGFLQNLLRGPVYEDYLALHGLLAARLMGSPAALSRKQIVALYDTIDRLIRGGSAWPDITCVPAATAEHYRALRRVRRPNNPALELLQITRAAVAPEMDHELYYVHFAAIIFITVAITVSHGRTRATVDDGWEAAEAYLKLFEVDPLELPPLVREGRSGYEKA